MLHELLWKANADLATACRDHPFVRGLGDGTLPSAAVRRYVAQDAFFLRAFLRAYALALAKCADEPHQRTLYELMGGVLDELRLHAAYAARLGIDLHDVAPLPAAQAYTDFLHETAWRAPLGEIIAAMTPCLRLYAWLGTALAPQNRPGHPYGDWIETYSGAAFGELADRLDALLDATADDTPAVRAAYRRAMECELAFFAAPLKEPA